MRFTLSNYGLPLLARELTELSSRKRTYVVRTVYAIVLYALASWSYWQWMGQFRPNSFESLGQGKPFFIQLVRWQFWGVYLSLPLLTCGAIAVEKERQTLQLLRLTKLGSWTIIFEKLGSRLFAMATFLLLPLPLAAVAYSMGGVEVSDLLKSVYVLSMTALQIGSFSLLCSAWFRTSTGAMLGAYLLGAAGMFYGSWVIRLVLVAAMHLQLHQLPWPGLDKAGRAWFERSVGQSTEYAPLSGPWVFGFRNEDEERLVYTATTENGVSRRQYFVLNNSDPHQDIDELVEFSEVAIPSTPIRWLQSAISGRTVRTSFADALICSIPLMLSAIFCLASARVVLWRGADSRPTSFIRALFLLTDRLLTAINRNPYTRGILLGTGERTLPDDRPLAWYETRYRLVSRLQDMVRILLLIELPLIVWFAWQAATHPMSLARQLPTVWIGIWLAALLVVIAVSTGIIPIERSRQTLDVVLTTPIAAADIVLQKMAGIRRIILLLSVPLWTFAALQVLWTWYVIERPFDTSLDVVVVKNESRFESDLESILASHRWLTVDGTLLWLGRSAAVPLYLSLTAWIGFQYGLRLKNQLQALIATMGTLAATCLIPMAVERTLGFYGDPHVLNLPAMQILDRLIRLLNPSWVLYQSEPTYRNALPSFLTSDILPKIWFPLLFHFLCVVGMLWQVRRNALRQFSRFVSRMEPATNRHVPLKVTEQIPVLDFEHTPAIRPGGSHFVVGQELRDVRDEK